jgi:hypothetical protein
MASREVVQQAAGQLLEVAESWAWLFREQRRLQLTACELSLFR